MAKQTFTVGQVLTAAQVTALQANDYNQTVSTKTTSYVLVAADVGTRVYMNAAGATTITVNTGLFAAGDTLWLGNIGAGACVVTAGTATVDKFSTASLTISQYQSAVLYFTSTGVSILYSDSAGASTPLTTKGDLFTYSTANARLAVGTNNQVLTADSAEATGIKWATAAAGGKVLQVVSAVYSTSQSTTTAADTGLSLSITPTSNTSKILVLVDQQISSNRSSGSPPTDLGGKVVIIRGSTTIYNNSAGNTSGLYLYIGSIGSGNLVYNITRLPFNFLDSPATTSSTTYKTNMSSYASDCTLTAQSGGASSSITLLEIGA